MTTIIRANESQAPIYGMWVLVAIVVVAAVALSVRMIVRARRAAREREVVWSEPKVSASAGTHSAGGAFDMGARPLTADVHAVLSNLMVGDRQVYPWPSYRARHSRLNEPLLFESPIVLSATPDLSHDGVIRWDFDVAATDLHKLVGFDADGDPVLAVDLVDGNIDLADVRRYTLSDN